MINTNWLSISVNGQEKARADPIDASVSIGINHATSIEASFVTGFLGLVQGFEAPARS